MGSKFIVEGLGFRVERLGFMETLNLATPNGVAAWSSSVAVHFETPIWRESKYTETFFFSLSTCICRAERVLY